MQPGLNTILNTDDEKLMYSETMSWLSLHFNPTEARSWCYYFTERHLFLPHFCSLLRSTVRPQFCSERLRVCHVTRVVWVWPKEAFSIKALGWCYWYVWVARVCESRSAMSSWTFISLTDEVPIKFFTISMIRDADTSRNCIWSRQNATVKIWIFPRIWWRCYNPAGSWSRLECVDLNSFGALVKGSILSFKRS